MERTTNQMINNKRGLKQYYIPTGSNRYRRFHTKTEKYIFFADAHGTVLMIDHLVGHKIM